MQDYKVGDVIEHNLVPGFRMTVQAVGPCETDSVRPEQHSQYKITDMAGETDWLCAYDVHKV